MFNFLKNIFSRKKEVPARLDSRSGVDENPVSEAAKSQEESKPQSQEAPKTETKPGA